LHGLCREHPLHDALELDLDVLGKHFLAQDCPQLGVERAGVEGVFAVAPVCSIRVPVGMFLNSAAAQARLGAPVGSRHLRRFASEPLCNRNTVTKAVVIGFLAFRNRNIGGGLFRFGIVRGAGFIAFVSLFRL